MKKNALASVLYVIFAFLAGCSTCQSNGNCRVLTQSTLDEGINRVQVSATARESACRALMANPGLYSETSSSCVITWK